MEVNYRSWAVIDGQVDWTDTAESERGGSTASYINSKVIHVDPLHQLFVQGLSNESVQSKHETVWGKSWPDCTIIIVLLWVFC